MFYKSQSTIPIELLEMMDTYQSFFFFLSVLHIHSKIFGNEHVFIFMAPLWYFSGNRKHGSHSKQPSQFTFQMELTACKAKVK